MRFTTLLCTTLLVACGGESSEQQTTKIWTEDSLHLHIDRYNGYVMEGEQSNTVFDYSKDEINTDALGFLQQVATTGDDLSCWEDGVSYTVTITQGSGAEQQYYSSNRSCGSQNEGEFVDYRELEMLVALLEGTE